MSVMAICKRLKLPVMIACAALVASGAGYSKAARIPSHQQPYRVVSGTHAGEPARSVLAYRETVRVPDAVWLRLHFSDHDLGERSYITITSIMDGAVQRLDAVSMKHYRSSSAFFNGDAVEIALHVGQGDMGIHFRIDEVTIGDAAGTGLSVLSLCGDDDRVPSADSRVGRVVYTSGGDTLSGGTGWITINTAHITAGHVVEYNLIDILQFNVPPSSCCGDTIRHPDPSDQYAVDHGNIIYAHHNWYGSDWAVFPCFPNSNTGLLPYQAQGRGFRVSYDHDPSHVSVTGFGCDSVPDGNCPPNCFYNEYNYTQQTDWGPYLGDTYVNEANIYFRYTVDTESGNSGSPVIVYGTDLTIGVHTYGYCHYGEGNRGTSFRNVVFQGTVNDFLGDDVVYLDINHPVVQEDGTVFRPFDTLTEAVGAATTGGTVFVVGGMYSDVMTISKPLTLVAPAGRATIGQ
jgi:hypothetical protein